MTEYTPLGFPVLPVGSSDLKTLTIGGAKFTIKKEAATAFENLLTFLNALDPFSEAGYDGGYSHRQNKNNAKVWSEHAAGTAVDVNASQHPNAVKLPAGWTAPQIRAIHWFLEHTATGRIFRWGGDYKSTTDSMHFEILSPAKLAEFNKSH